MSGGCWLGDVKPRTGNLPRATSLFATVAALWGLLLAALLVAAPAAAEGDISKELAPAQAALAARDYDTAFREYSRFAEDNDNPLAQFVLALFYQQGWGRPASPSLACGWYRRAAAGDIPTAQHRYAECLAGGMIGPADPASAATWFERAARNGHVISYCSLARLYISGDGVAKDPARGLALCREVAEKGSVPAQVIMGRFYLDGEAGVRDFQRAYAWFEGAARRDSAEAQFHLGRMMRDALVGGATPEAARHWYESAAGQGYVPAYFPTAELYFAVPADPASGLRPPEDVAKAYLWLSAVTQRSRDLEQRAAAREMLDELLKIMPETWIPTLDQKVARHLEQYPKTPLNR